MIRLTERDNSLMCLLGGEEGMTFPHQASITTFHLRKIDIGGLDSSRRETLRTGLRIVRGAVVVEATDLLEDLASRSIQLYRRLHSSSNSPWGGAFVDWCGGSIQPYNIPPPGGWRLMLHDQIFEISPILAICGSYIISRPPRTAQNTQGAGCREPCYASVLNG